MFVANMVSVSAFLGVALLGLGIGIHFLTGGKTPTGRIILVFGVIFLGLSFFIENKPELGQVVPSGIHLFNK